MRLFQRSGNPRSAVIKRAGLAAAAVLFVLTGSARASSILVVEGATLGCFEAGCSTFTSTAVSNTTYGLTFSGAPFDVVTDETGSATNIVLGTLTRGNTSTPADSTALPFTLQVNFTLPTGIGGGGSEVFSALITGVSAVGGGGAIPVDFDNAWQFFEFSNEFGTGSFYFSVTNDPGVNKNNGRNPEDIVGAIRDAIYTPREETTESEAVTAPEPAAFALFGVGLVATAIRRRLARS